MICASTLFTWRKDSTAAPRYLIPSALHAGHRERRSDRHPPLAVPGQRAGRSGPGAHAAHGHRLHPERHHAPAALPLRARPVQVQALSRHRQHKQNLRQYFEEAFEFIGTTQSSVDGKPATSISTRRII